MGRRTAWPDARLIEAARTGDVPALTAVVVESQPHVRTFARSLCATPQDAEDAAQEALIILYRKIGTLRATGALASWMFRIVRNECLRRLRPPFPTATGATGAAGATGDGWNGGDGWDGGEAGGGAEPSAEEAALRGLEAERIAAAIGALPRDQRQVLIMRDVRGLPGRTVARALGIGTPAMKSRLHRARTALRAALAAEGVAP
ncbi:RNA polymerase sigma factor [Streptomyces termitum]|uniref:RNA polymerase sigma factor n=1 Tax=Streptomyces termitum TaxID=67368 RepID=A0A918T6B2_9ACTN|nr:RNA polymerase sigma factor [Streptomyces termitum]GHA94875.1 RNA polymerase sigma factor [Streptomyces termitum]